MNQSACPGVVVIVTVGIAIAVVVNGQTPGEAAPPTDEHVAPPRQVTVSLARALRGRAVLTDGHLTHSIGVPAGQAG